MKRIYSFIVLFVAVLSLSAAETTKWTGSQAISWNTDSYPGIQVDTWSTEGFTGIFTGLAKDDVIRLYVTPGNDAQYALKYKAGDGWEWTDLAFTTGSGVLSYTVESSDIAAYIVDRGLVISGQDYVLTKITVETPSGDPQPVSTGETYTAWTGEKVFGSSWSAWEQIPASAFAQAQKDMLLRFKFKDVSAGAQFRVSKADWNDMPDAPIVNIDGVYQQYTITEAMLTALQSGGAIISGISFTLTSIEVINPADLKPLTVSVPVTGGDWVFENENPTFIIQATNPYSEPIQAHAVIMIATDKMAPVTELVKDVEIAAGATENITFTWTEPAPAAGFYKATCLVNDELARAFFFGVNPTQIVSAPDKQADFESFWQTAKDELAAIEATDEPVLTKIDSKSTDKRTVYLVEFKSVSNGDGVAETVRGYYCEPNDGKKHPVIMHYLGYDSDYRPGGQDATPWCPNGDGDELSADYAEFILSTRGQSINNRPASDRADGIDRDFTNTYGDWFAYNFGDKDKYYYRGAYMDCVRAIDFMATRPTSDMTNHYAEGQSQGGAFTYAAAALSGREFKAIAPGIAFMGDFPDYFDIVNWPAYVAREQQEAKGMSDAEMYAFLSYFDTKNLATLISNKTAVIATIGVQDNVCPPHTNIAPYNNLADGTVKEISFNPENAHQVGNDWYNVYMNYFKSKYVEPQSGENNRTVNAQKLYDLLTSLYGNKIISGTTAVVDWNTKQAEQIYEWTGKYPAMNTYDFINIHASKDVNADGWLDYSNISGVKKWASEGGLVSIMWHWQVKNNAGTGYTCTPGTGDAATTFDASKIYVDGTTENTLAKQQLSQVCGYLRQMKDADIPVIWRPFHEAAGNTYEFDGGNVWFWWGAQGAEVYKQLWHWMYDYMVNQQGLTNLLWVWTSQTKDGNWYPGDDYVDIVGRDIYGGQTAQQKSDFDALTASYPDKMVALSECGNTNQASQSDISALWETGAKWSWFSSWYDAAGSQLHNTQDWWSRAFNQDYVVTRDQMKTLVDFGIEADAEPDANTLNLDDFAAMDAGVSYDNTTHVMTTTAAWTGGQLWIGENSTYSGSKLVLTTQEECKLKMFVGYVGGESLDMADENASTTHHIAIDNTKKIEKVIIQNQEVGSVTFLKLELDPVEDVLLPLEPGEVRTLFDEADGVVMSWNEICQQDAEYGAILETGESFLVTVKQLTEGSEWPKAILRDANSEAVFEVELSEVTSYPYIVKILLTDEIVSKLRGGFRFSGDGITITKIELSKPAPAQEGDITIDAMNWFRNATYDVQTHEMVTTSRWGQAGWAVGDERYAGKTLIIVSIEETTFPVTLKMEYTNTDGKAMATSMGVAAGKTQLNLPLPLDTKVIKKVYLTYSAAGSAVLTDASVIAAANARPETGYEDNVSTGVADVRCTMEDGRGEYFDLQGRKVNGQWSSQRHTLKERTVNGQWTKGLYIINGKKVIR